MSCSILAGKNVRNQIARLKKNSIGEKHNGFTFQGETTDMTQLRGPEALAVLRHKEGLRANLVESDTLAVLKAGNRTFTLPVFIQQNGGAAIESDFTFHEARANTNIVVDGQTSTIVKFEKVAEPVVIPPAPPEPTENEIFEHRLKLAREANPNVSGWVLQKQVRAAMFQEGLATQQKVRQEQQDLTIPNKWASFAEAAKRARNSR
jgi:hypothetical protein